MSLPTAVGVERFTQSRPLTLQLDSEKPFRILLAGDFSGGASHGQPILIDRDNFDHVLARLSPELHLAPGTTLRFRELEDFHPDRLCRQMPNLGADAAREDQVRAILHHPEFQGLEAAWRGAFFLISRLETAKVYLLDLARAELGGMRIEESVWNIVAVNYTFEPSRADAALLTALARRAARGDVPLLAAAHPRAVGCESFVQSAGPEDWSYEPGEEDRAAWQALRRSPDAAWVGLALPRFLLRLPYGKETSPLKEFPFEEMPGESAHEQYLWGNPAVACAFLMSENSREIDSLPTHTYRSQGLPCMKPCAEVLLTDRAAERILDCGVMPLLSVRDCPSAMLGRIQSIADPPQALRGRWRQ
jgi:type VI secretion system protein ImpC